MGGQIETRECFNKSQVNRRRWKNYQGISSNPEIHYHTIVAQIVTSHCYNQSQVNTRGRKNLSVWKDKKRDTMSGK